MALFCESRIRPLTLMNGVTVMFITTFELARPKKTGLGRWFGFDADSL